MVEKNFQKIHPVILAAQAHHKLAHIHPFTDGNGRTARLFMNVILIQHGYPLVIILKNDRKKYYRALEKADSGNMDDLEKIVAQSVERSMNIYINAIQVGSKEDALLPLSTLTKFFKFSEKYLNLLARTGAIDAQKEGRIWLSSQNAIKKYLENRQRKRS